MHDIEKRHVIQMKLKIEYLRKDMDFWLLLKMSAKIQRKIQVKDLVKNLFTMLKNLLRKQLKLYQKE